MDRILNPLSLRQKNDTLLVSAFNIEEPLTAFCCVTEIRVRDRPCRNACPVLLLNDHGEREAGLKSFSHIRPLLFRGQSGTDGGS